MKIEDVARGWIDEIGRIGVSHLPATQGPGMDDGLRTPRPTVVARAALHDGIGVRRIGGAPRTQIVGGQQIAVRSGRKGWDSVKNTCRMLIDSQIHDGAKEHPCARISTNIRQRCRHCCGPCPVDFHNGSPGVADDLLTEEEISARLIGAGDITRDEFRLGGGRNWGRSPA